MTSRLHFLWEKSPAAQFTTGVSLHSHTLLSRESLDFIQRATRGIPIVAGASKSLEKRYRELKNCDLDLRRAWWTPPLSPRQAFDLESSQISNVLGMRPMVSLSDHDDVAAGLQLRAIAPDLDVPVSVEWTVPFRRTFFHIGVHGLPPEHANLMMCEMRRVTASPHEDEVEELLSWFASDPATLIVFNHPAWDESHSGARVHRDHVEDFLGLYRHLLHAVELNGLRPWKENRLAAQVAELAGLPLISGGDRHGREPNACVNVTNARTFAEFVAEIRSDGHSEIVFMPQYRESLQLRLIENLAEVLRDDPDHAMGWTTWSSRVFCESDEDGVMSMAELWGQNDPSIVNHFVHLMSLLRFRHVKSALRYALNSNVNYVL